jgi:asparagine synthase (glutamine-hydrolysing)
MSAIWGIINKKGKPIDQQLVDSIFTSIAHRATDGKGLWIEQNVALGHCLLKVHPQQDFENQPEQLSDLIITADARLDNRSELAVKFGLDRAQLSETPDSTLLLMAYRHWGNECVQHMEGEYAFTIWNKQTQQLFAATDNIGFRPFFYYDSPDQFIFCSEIKGVVAAKPLPNYFEEESLIEYFYRKGSPNKTYNKEIFALCGGNTLTLKDGKIDIHKYWTLESTGKYRFKKDEEWYDCTRELVYKAIENRLNPDVPTGITLSGGLDSTSIACILSELLAKKNKPLYAFSSVLPVDYKGIEKDERHYIELVGKHCPNIIQTYVEAPGVGPITNIEEAFEIEETFPNSFFYMDKALLNAASNHHIRNLYTGFGGDFWLSWKGNRAVYELIRSGDYAKAINLIRQIQHNQKSSLTNTIRQTYLGHLEMYKKTVNLLRNRKLHKIEDNLLIANLLNKTKHYSTYNKQMQAYVNDGKFGRIASMLYNRNSHGQADSSLPFLDKNLICLLNEIPIQLFISNGVQRDLIRKVMNNIIPHEINQRETKMAFSPDYKARVWKDLDYMQQISARIKDSKLIGNYINTTNATMISKIIKENQNFPPIFYNQIIHLNIACKIALYLEKKKYELQQPPTNRCII